MWKCKKCGGTDFKVHLDSSISSGIILRHKNFVVDKADVLGFECQDCNSYNEDIEGLAD
jgi:hypothetical protein